MIRSARPLSALFALLVLTCAGACGDAPSPRAEPPARPVALRIACFNIWGVPLVAQDLDGRLERMLPALEALDLDVICFQEVFRSSVRQRVLDGLGPGYVGTEGTAGGLLIASRLAIREAVFSAFPVHPALGLAERLARKGYLEALLETPTGPLRVITTHLAAEWSPNGPRSRQREQLTRVLGSRRDAALVLAGDLNTAMVGDTGPTTAYDALRAAGLASADPPRETEPGLWATPVATRVGWPRSARARGWTPDHVFVRDGPHVSVEVLSYAVALDTPATAVSDHNLLLVTVRLSPRP